MTSVEDLAKVFPHVRSRAGAIYCEYMVGDTNTLDFVRAELLELDWVTQRTARHEYFMSNIARTYKYGKGTSEETYVSKKFSPYVYCMMVDLNKFLDARFNVCFLNKYDNEQQHLGWHADQFDGMVQDSPIACVSFGAERYIYTKPRDQKGKVPDDQKFLLREDSVFIMPPGFQDTHLHKIPKHDRPCGWRISLTFRQFE